MRASDVMTSGVKSCRPDWDLASVASLMWECDCGTVPVVTGDGHVVGMITDRDICIAAATRCTAPQNIPVQEVMATQVRTCALDDDVRTVLNTMKEARVRRLPVLDEQGRLTGIISLNDLVSRAECRKGADVPAQGFIETLKAISEHSATAAAA